MYLRIWLRESFLVFLVMSDVKNTGRVQNLRSLMV